MKRKTFLMGAVMLLCAVLPSSLRAEEVNAPFLCIEKTNGEVVKVPITDEYPTIRYTFTIQDSETKQQVVHYLRILLAEDEDIWIPRDEIKCLYSSFEDVDAMENMYADAKEQYADIYTVSGLYMGKQNQVKRMPRGVYLMKKGSRTIKIVNK